MTQRKALLIDCTYVRTLLNDNKKQGKIRSDGPFTVAVYSGVFQCFRSNYVDFWNQHNYFLKYMRKIAKNVCINVNINAPKSQKRNT